ncbi:hypothetical protein DZC31_30950 (plasmid) [Stenotrophomonas rhizophila]|nr:hypothetical protein DZC31_30950 [Stenotrophomonas rhizophila]
MLFLGLRLLAPFFVVMTYRSLCNKAQAGIGADFKAGLFYGFSADINILVFALFKRGYYQFLRELRITA